MPCAPGPADNTVSSPALSAEAMDHALANNSRAVWSNEEKTTREREKTGRVFGSHSPRYFSPCGDRQSLLPFCTILVTPDQTHAAAKRKSARPRLTGLFPAPKSYFRRRSRRKGEVVTICEKLELQLCRNPKKYKSIRLYKNIRPQELTGVARGSEALADKLCCIELTLCECSRKRESRSPEQEEPSSRTSVRLHPTSTCHEEQGIERTPPHSRPASKQSPYFRTFLTPGNPKTMQIQVKELEDEVADLAEQLQVSQEEVSITRARNEHLRKALHQENALAADFEVQLRQSAANCARIKEQAVEVSTKCTHLQVELDYKNSQVVDLSTKCTHLHTKCTHLHAQVEYRDSQVLELSNKCSHLQAGLVYKDSQRSRERLLLSAHYSIDTWKAQVGQSRRSFRLARQVLSRKLQAQVLGWWRLMTSPHLSVVRFPHVLKWVGVSPLQAAMVLAERGHRMILDHLGWRPRARRHVFRRWRALAVQRHHDVRKLDFVRRKCVVGLGTTRRQCFRAWRVVSRYLKTSCRHLFAFEQRLSRSCRGRCWIVWKRYREVLVRLQRGCNSFLYGFVRRFLSSWLHSWRCILSQRDTQSAVIDNVKRRGVRTLLVGAMRRWTVWLCMATDKIVVRLLHSAGCPLSGQLAIAKSASVAWRSQARASALALWRTLQISRHYRKGVVEAVFCRRLLQLLATWRWSVRLKALSFRLQTQWCARVKRRVWNEWQVWQDSRMHLRRVVHTGVLVTKRTHLVLMYQVVAEWYRLVEVRFQQVVRVAKQYFVAWATGTGAEAQARESKGQALEWLSRRSLALRTLLVWVFRGGRARSLHLARRWTSRAFHRWVSSTFTGRTSLPDALRRADAVLERLLYS